MIVTIAIIAAIVIIIGLLIWAAVALKAMEASKGIIKDYNDDWDQHEKRDE